MKKQNKKTMPVKKVGKDFCGSKETYTKDYYDFGSKKFNCAKHSDVWGNGRSVRGTQKVTTDFFY